MQGKNRRFVSISIFVIATNIAGARAGLIYESATSGPTGQTGGGGVGVSDDFLTCCNFQVTETTHVGSIGGHFWKVGFSDVTTYAAIVALTGQFDVPDSLNLSTPDVLGVSTFSPSDPSDNSSANLQLTLSPGWYAMVFGSGLFGTSGDALALSNNTPVGSPVIYVVRRSDGAVFFQAAGPRFFASTDVVPSLTKLVDTNDLIPGSAVNFTSFSGPSLRGRDVVFRANGPIGSGAHEQGVYKIVDGTLQMVANKGTIIPGGSNPISSFGTWTSISRGAAAFNATASASERGIYTDDGGVLTAVADLNTPIPGGVGNFTGFWAAASIDHGNVVFSAGGANSQQGYYARIGGNLVAVADANTPAPGQAFNFDVLPLNNVEIGDGVVGFRAFNQATLYGAVVAYQNGVLETIADTNTILPGQVAPLPFFGLPHVRRDRMCFAALDSFAAPTIACTYKQTRNGLEEVVCLGDPLPGTATVFGNFFEPSFDGRHVSFVGMDPSNNMGLYSDITGELTKVVAEGDFVDGKLVSGVGIGYEQIDGDAIVFGLSFDDGSRGIYLADYPVIRPGDIDDDGDIDFVDRDLFVNVLMGTPVAPAHVERADMNDDGDSDGRDVALFSRGLLEG